MSCILLLLDHTANRRLLAGLLTPRHKILQPAPSPQALEAEFDLCILDGATLNSLEEAIRVRRQREAPVFLPFILLTSQQDVGMATRHLWQTIDEVICTPIEKVELQARMESMLMARRMSAEMHRVALREAPLAAILLDAHDHVCLWNRAAEELFGWSEAEMLEQPLPWGNGEMPGGKLLAREMQLADKAGQMRWVELSLAPMQVGNEKRTLLLINDISARKEAQEALALSESRLRTTLYSIGDAVIATDAEGRVAIMNAIAEQLTGWSEAEAQGKALEEVFVIVNEESHAAIENPVQRVLREGVVIGLANHTLLIARDGREYPIADAGAPIRDAAGNITGVVLVFRDQSAERAARRAVEEARQFAEGIIATVREPLLVLDADLRVVSANRAFYHVFQTTPEETTGRFVYELGNRQWDIPELRQLLEEILPQNTHFDDYEVRHRFEHFGERIMLLNARRLYHDEAKTNLILLAIEDVTERRQAEAKLRQSEGASRRIAEEWQATFDASSDAIWLLDLQQRVTRANRATEEMFHWPLQEIIGARCFEFIHGTTEPIPQCPCRRVHQSLRRESTEMQINGRWFYITVDPLLDAENRLVGTVHTARDITAQKVKTFRVSGWGGKNDTF